MKSFVLGFFIMLSCSAFAQNYKEQLRQFEAAGDFLHGYKTWGKVVSASSTGGDCRLDISSGYNHSYYSLNFGVTVYPKRRHGNDHEKIIIKATMFEASDLELLFSCNEYDYKGDMTITKVKDRIFVSFKYIYTDNYEHNDEPIYTKEFNCVFEKVP